VIEQSEDEPESSHDLNENRTDKSMTSYNMQASSCDSRDDDESSISQPGAQTDESETDSQESSSDSDDDSDDDSDYELADSYDEEVAN